MRNDGIDIILPRIIFFRFLWLKLPSILLKTKKPIRKLISIRTKQRKWLFNVSIPERIKFPYEQAGCKVAIWWAIWRLILLPGARTQLPYHFILPINDIILIISIEIAVPCRFWLNFLGYCNGFKCSRPMRNREKHP